MGETDTLQSVCAVLIRKAPADEVGEGPQILLIKRKFPPDQGLWALPGGFVKKDESPEHALIREVLKETQLDVKDLVQFKLSPRLKEDRDPRGKIMALPGLFIIQDGDEVVPGENVSNANWFFLDEIEHLALDHGAILCEAMGKTWPLMVGAQKELAKLSMPKSFMKKSYKKDDKVVFYCGSFNPWHEGHRACLDLCPEENIIIVPDKNPWKKEIKDTSCAWQSYSQLSLKFKDDPWSIYPAFLGQEKGNPTVDWLPLCQYKHIWLLMGQDTFLELLKWKEAQHLLASLEGIYVVDRLEQSGKEFSAKSIEQCQKSIKKINKAIKIIPLSGNQSSHLSSSQLRQKSSK